MYTNNAYLNNSITPIRDESKPLIVTSCGTYRLYTHPRLTTRRPRGRIDYQLLYIASGKAHFFFNGKDEIITAGHMILYRPKEPQLYEYLGTDQTEVYWVHFTGSNVKNLLLSYGLTDEKSVFFCGSGLEHKNHFRIMIQELQMRKDGYPEMLEMHLRQILITLHRHINASSKVENKQIADDIDGAIVYFTEHYNENICIDDYAKKHNMSTGWFIRSFKHYTGTTPMQYILSIRICNAEALLAVPQYNITEIAAIVGYENPLYFSRIFKKAKGISPSEYRKNISI